MQENCQKLAAAFRILKASGMSNIITSHIRVLNILNAVLCLKLWPRHVIAYVATRGPWKAKLALIKVDGDKINEHFSMQKIFKTGETFWEEAQRVCTFIKTAAKRPFSLATPQLDEAIDQSETRLWWSTITPSVSQGIICQDWSRRLGVT